MTSIKLIDTKTLEVNGKLVETNTREIFVFKNEKGEFIKRVKKARVYFFPKDENGTPILDFWNNIGYWREKYKHSRIFEDLINKKNNGEMNHIPIKRRKVKVLSSLYSFCFFIFCWIVSRIKLPLCL